MQEGRLTDCLVLSIVLYCFVDVSPVSCWMPILSFFPMGIYCTASVNTGANHGGSDAFQQRRQGVVGIHYGLSLRRLQSLVLASTSIQESILAVHSSNQNSLLTCSFCFGLVVCLAKMPW